MSSARGEEPQGSLMRKLLRSVWLRLCDEGVGGWQGISILRKKPAYLFKV